MRLLGLLTVLLCAAPAPPAAAGQRQGAPAADFTLPDLAGQGVRLSSLRGRVVVIDFWASWCEPCKKELPELEKLQRQLGAKVAILPVNIDRERQAALDAVRRLGLSMRVLLDPEGKVAELYDPPKMPTSYVVDREGLVRHVHEGYEGPKDVARLRGELEQLTR